MTAKIQIDPNVTKGDAKYIASSRAVKHFFTEYARGTNIPALLIGPTWIQSGSPFLLGLVEQNVTISNPGAFVSDMETKKIDIIKGQKNKLYASADASFHSAATVTPGALGAITFELRTPTDSSEIIFSSGVISSGVISSGVISSGGEAVANRGGVTIGTVTMPSTFGVLPGKNHVSANVEMIKDGTTANAFAIAHFIDQYAMGNHQNMILFGPINHSTTILNGFLKQNFIASGISNPNLVVGSVLTKTSVAGYKVNVSKCCFV